MAFKGKKPPATDRPGPAGGPLVEAPTSWFGGGEPVVLPEPGSVPTPAEENKAPRVLFLGVFDRSGSVSSHAGEIDRGVADMAQAVAAHGVACWSVELALGFIGHPPRVEPFRPVTGFVVPTVSVTGTSPYGTSLDLGTDEVLRRVNALSAAGVETHKVVAAVVGDGRANAEPPDVTARAVERWRALQARDSVGLVCFPVCVGSADDGFMGRLSLANKPKDLRRFDFRSLFYWLSQALISVSVSQPGEAVRMPPTDAWSA